MLIRGGFQLRLWAMGLGAMAFGFLLLAQLAVRYWFHLPAMQQLVDISDQKDRARVEAVLHWQLVNLENRALDNAIWDDAYDYMRQPDPRFIASSFDVSVLADNQLSGLAFVHQSGRIQWAMGYEWHANGLGPPTLQGLPVSEAQMFQHLLIPSNVPEGDKIEIRRGYLAAHEGPLMFVSVPIYPTAFGDGSQASEGVLVMWRWLDSSFWRQVSSSTHLRVSAAFLPRQYDSLPAPFAQLRAGDTWPRTEENQLLWLLMGVSGPLMLVQVELDSPPVDDALITDALLVGMVSALLLLIVLGYCVHYWLIRPLAQLHQQVDGVVRQGDYRQRLDVQSYRELEQLAAQFNQLLAEVQRQQAMAQRRQAELQLASISDALTGLANRRYLDQFMDETWVWASQARVSFSLILVDVDFFKDYNDHYGHDAGDQVLRQVARCLRQNQPAEKAIVARYGGEEFCIVAAGLELARFEQLAEKICADIQNQQLNHAHSHLGVVTVSVGAVYIDGLDVSLPQLKGRDALRSIFKAADSCLYQAKRDGRNRVCTCDARKLPGI